MKPERRKDARYDAPLAVEFIETEKGTRFYPGTTLNVSGSGMCIATEYSPPALQGSVEIKITLPGGKTSAPAVGDIIWADCAGERCLLGIRFQSLDEEAREGILAYCRKLGMYSQ